MFSTAQLGALVRSISSVPSGAGLGLVLGRFAVGLGLGWSRIRVLDFRARGVWPFSRSLVYVAIDRHVASCLVLLGCRHLGRRLLLNYRFAMLMIFQLVSSSLNFILPAIRVPYCMCVLHFVQQSLQAEASSSHQAWILRTA